MMTVTVFTVLASTLRLASLALLELNAAAIGTPKVFDVATSLTVAALRWA